MTICNKEGQGFNRYIVECKSNVNIYNYGRTSTITTDLIDT